MNVIDTKEARKLLESAKETKGQFFGVEFVSRGTGERKVINGKAEMRKGLKGIGKRYSDKLHGLVTVWARNRDGYRSIPLEGITQINMNGETYLVKPSKETFLVGLGLRPLFSN